MSKDYSIWVVPPGSAPVRKFRISSRALAASCLCGCIVLGGILHLTFDYVRVQASRLKQVLSLTEVARERSTLAVENRDLEERLRRSQSGEERLKAFERSVQSRMQDLSQALQGLGEFGISPSTLSRGSPTAGGGEAQGQARSASAALADASVRPHQVDLNGSTSSRIRRGRESVNPGRKSAKSNLPTTAKRNSSLGGPEGIEIGDRLLLDELGVNHADRAEIEHPDRVSRRQRSDAVRQGRSSPPGGSSATLQMIDSYVDAIRKLPMAMPSRGELTSTFGVRKSPFTQRLQLHRGMDISLPSGSIVRAAGHGVVKSAEWRNGYGFVIEIEHVPGVVTRYAHLSKALVSAGTLVKQGQLIARSGSTGRSTGPHLHYEVRIKGKAIDPARFLRMAQNLRVIM